MVDTALLHKYNVPVPRYTSYPTVPYWKDSIDAESWKGLFAKRFSEENSAAGISLYIHLPFCESLCTYCGCNKKITTNHSVEEGYMEAIRKEWAMYRALMPERPLLRELHLGGGTPTFFSPGNLRKLILEILSDCDAAEGHEFSIEGHPNNTTADHLTTLYDLGFRRISYGVQDNDPDVQRVINRIQPFGNVQRATEMARKIGYTSVNFDLIYGLPLQNIEKMRKTLEQSISLKPDRVAFYSYAHVPWTSRGQRLFDENDLPSPELKMELYRLGKEMFADAGYTDIGMDHFAFPSDELCIAHSEGRLHRNFMGYTTQNTSMLIGLGVSAISDLVNGFMQNNKVLAAYLDRIQKGELPVEKGYFLNGEDVVFRRYILDIACKGRAEFRTEDLPLLRALVFPRLEEYAADGLVRFSDSGLVVTAMGRHFTRNICSAFDLHLRRSEARDAKPLFSKAV
jgi:oxygen-independent coproporphyrinogen III oxidase